MPELPEVETIARGLNKRIAGDTIESVWLGDKPQVLKSPAVEIASVLEHSRIVHVRRVGKHLVFDLEMSGAHVSESARRGAPAHSETRDRAQWIVHLGMTGQLLIGSPETEMLKHTHAVLKLQSGRELRFVDVRRFGRLSVLRIEADEGTGFGAAGRSRCSISTWNFIPLFRIAKHQSRALC